MLEKCLAETDPETTDVVVMAADVVPLRPWPRRRTIAGGPPIADGGGDPGRARGQAGPAADRADQRPVCAVARIAGTIGAQELIMGPSNRFRPEDQIDEWPCTGLKAVRNARAADDPRPGQEPRHAAGHRRRQSYSPGR